MNEPTANQWLLLIYKIPTEPTRFRTYIWRHVKTLGCLNLHKTAWLLPKTPDLEAETQKLAVKIEEFGGEVSLLTTTSPGAEWEAKVIAGFNAIRDEEYAEVTENEERFEDEIHRETRKQKFTFAELEDMEAEWEKINQGMRRAQARDYFGAPGRREAEARLAEGARLLDTFSKKVYEREGVEGSAGTKEDGGQHG